MAPGTEQDVQSSGDRAVRLYIAALAAVAIAAVGADVLVFGWRHVDNVLLAAAFVPVLAASEYLIVRFRYRDQIDGLNLFEAVLTPLLFSFPVPAAVLAVGVAQVTAGIARRNRPRKAAFNVCQWMVAVATGGFVLDALRQGPSLTAANLAATVGAVVVVSAVNQAEFSVVIALAEGRPLRHVFGALQEVFLLGWALGGAVNAAFGVLFLAAYQWSAVSVGLFVVPLLVLHWANKAYAAARADEVRLRALHHASALLAEPVDPFDAVDDFLAEVRRCFETEAAELLIVTENGPVIYRSPASNVPYTATAMTGVLSLQKPVRLSGSEISPQPAWRDCLAAPLVNGEETIGALCTYNRNGLEGFEDGELAVLAVLAADVVAAVERSRLVQRVVDERRTLRDIIGSASDGIFTLGQDGTVTSWNPALTGITGYRADDVVGRRDLAVLRPRDSERRDVILERWAERDVALPTDLQILTRTGELRWLSCSYSTVASSDGDGSLIVIARDVTKEREVERLREDFVATVSHELRTPLSPIKGWAATLLDFGDKLNAVDRREGLQSILRQAQRLERLVVNLLEVSKIEHGSLDADIADVDVSAVAHRVVEDFHAAFPERTFHLDGADEPCWASAKELWVEQILSNLVSNAVKYSSEATPVEVTVEPGLDHIGVVVVDHGCGIPAHELERVFERFHRVRETVTQTGTGLGLYIARQLAEEVGGHVSVESVPGRGSQFTLELPAAVRVVDVRPSGTVVHLEAG